MPTPSRSSLYGAERVGIFLRNYSNSIAILSILQIETVKELEKKVSGTSILGVQAPKVYTFIINNVMYY